MGRPALKYQGVVPILATPFHDDESLDLKSLERLISFLRRVGVEAMTVLGVLGEADRLSESERQEVARGAIRAAGPVPVIVGAIRPDTRAAVEAVERAARLGASAAMVAPLGADPLEHFLQAAEPGLPIIVQDHPASSGVQMPVDLLLRLVHEVPAIAGIKCEALPTPAKIAALKQGMAGGRSVPVLGGLGALYGRFEREHGSDGFNTGFAFPEVLRAMLGPDAAGIYARYLPLLVFEQQPGVAIRKEILRQRRLLATNQVRRPQVRVDAATSDRVARLLEETFPGQDLTAPVRIGPS